MKEKTIMVGGRKTMPRSAGRSPLAEGITSGDAWKIRLCGKLYEIPLKRNGQRDWGALSDDDIIDYARAYCEENKIGRISELEKGKYSDRGLLHVLRKRDLTGRVFERREFEEVILDGRTFRIRLDNKGRRNWVSMSDGAIVDYARAYCNEKGITKISELENGSSSDSGLCAILRIRNLIDSTFKRVGFDEVTLDGRMFRIPLDKKQKRNWARMSGDELVVYAKAYCKEKKITRPSELKEGADKDNGLYIQLGRRKLKKQVFEKKEFDEVVLDGRRFRIPLDKKQDRNWEKMSDDELVEFARAYCIEKGIGKASKLKRGSDKDSGLDDQLHRRGLMAKVFKRKEFEEVILDGRKFMIPLNAEGNRNWAKMSDDELVEYARAYCKEKGITKSSELVRGPNNDSGLWSTLQRRGLLDRVFAGIREKQEAAALTGIADALVTFGGGNEKKN